ncbi:MAG: PrsW family intramembrane metalloprotease [Leptospira sp.]|nr:PrsW family intramembrane metalloprotease [Leptospira sp.]
MSLLWGFFSVLPWVYALWASFPKKEISFSKLILLSLLGLSGGILSTYLILEVNPLIWPDVDITARRPKSLLTQTIHFAFIQAGMVEESFKIFFILLISFFLARKSKLEWDKGIFLVAGFTALGFAFIENSYYIMSEIPERRLETYLGRTVHSSNIHLLINLCFALFCLKSNEIEALPGKLALMGFAFLLAVVQHGVVDFFLIPSSNLGGWIATAMFVGIWVWVVRDFRVWVLGKDPMPI